ncbi:MAG: twin-arginine translocase TatA/TatE family subunit [Anaerolineales bacterium]|nr:twin-arginine translocase TatA/TatE family subunit [Chloroflexota bacterium]MBL6981691.1 twin-arginine translocase TatA/TatE family subunit [Anaerolineales bacterium]
MDFLGIGPLELVFVLLIALIIFGPKDIIKAGRTVGRFLRTIVKSDSWKAFQEASKGMRNLPNTLMREAGIEEEELKNMTGLTDLENTTKDLDNQISPWTTPPPKNAGQPEISEETSTSGTESPPTDASEEIPPSSSDT